MTQGEKNLKNLAEMIILDARGEPQVNPMTPFDFAVRSLDAAVLALKEIAELPDVQQDECGVIAKRAIGRIGELTKEFEQGLLIDAVC